MEKGNAEDRELVIQELLELGITGRTPKILLNEFPGLTKGIIREISDSLSASAGPGMLVTAIRAKAAKLIGAEQDLREHLAREQEQAEQRRKEATAAVKKIIAAAAKRFKANANGKACAEEAVDADAAMRRLKFLAAEHFAQATIPDPLPPGAAAELAREQLATEALMEAEREVQEKDRREAEEAARIEREAEMDQWHQQREADSVRRDQEQAVEKERERKEREEAMAKSDAEIKARLQKLNEFRDGFSDEQWERQVAAMHEKWPTMMATFKSPITLKTAVYEAVTEGRIGRVS